MLDTFVHVGECLSHSYLLRTVLSTRHSCQKTWEKNYQEWPAGKTESEIKLLIQKYGKPQDLIAYTDGSVTKDQSGWCFTVEQGATTIHEYSAAYTVSTSSLTMEAEAATHALRCNGSRVDSRTTHAIILKVKELATKSEKNGMGSPEWNVSMVDIHLPKLPWVHVLPWTCRCEGK